MARKRYSELSIKAAIITGGVVGFIWSLLTSLFIGSMMGAYGYGMMQGYGYGIVFIIAATIFFAIAFGFVALVYNYALRNW